MLAIFIFITFFFIVEIAYFRIANRLNIIDKPNERSSHSFVTIRGAGVIFPIAVIIPLIYTNNLIANLPFVLGLIAISIISFLDDVTSLKNAIRISIHFISVSLLMLQVNAFSGYWYLIPFSFIMVVGVINAYNFMDGINGITALYSLVAIVSFYFIRNDYVTPFSEIVYLSIIASLLVFSFYNLRKKAKCFSGDVGSISIAFVLSYLVLFMIMATGQGKWMLMLGIYGLDSVATIFLRIVRKENIFQAHRSHFYQFLVNEVKWPHLFVAFLYSVIQLILNFVIVSYSTYTVLFVFSGIVVIYAILRLQFEGKQRLFSNY